MGSGAEGHGDGREQEDFFHICYFVVGLKGLEAKGLKLIKIGLNLYGEGVS